MNRLLSSYRRSKLFTQDEAWLLFRLAAWAESFGWTLLISGLLLKKFVMHGSDTPVKITGQIHGTLFLAYFALSIVLAPSLGWSIRKSLVAIAASVPPYGSLVFELWQARHLKRQSIKLLYFLNVYQELRLIENRA